MRVFFPAGPLSLRFVCSWAGSEKQAHSRSNRASSSRSIRCTLLRATKTVAIFMFNFSATSAPESPSTCEKMERVPGSRLNSEAERDSTPLSEAPDRTLLLIVGSDLFWQRGRRADPFLGSSPLPRPALRCLTTYTCHARCVSVFSHGSKTAAGVIAKAVHLNGQIQEHFLGDVCASCS